MKIFIDNYFENAPENVCLYNWLIEKQKLNTLPIMAIDIHNDEDGRLHFHKSNNDTENHKKRLLRFDEVLQKHTWVTEGNTGFDFINPGTIGEGLNEIFGIDSIIWELKADNVKGLNNRPALHTDWIKLGTDFINVIKEYFEI